MGSLKKPVKEKNNFVLESFAMCENLMFQITTHQTIYNDIYPSKQLKFWTRSWVTKKSHGSIPLLLRSQKVICVMASVFRDIFLTKHL